MAANNLKEIAIKYALHNAILHDGKASFVHVMGKLIAWDKELKKDIARVKEVVNQAIEEVNSMHKEEQVKMLEKLDPEMLKKEEHKKTELPELVGAKPGHVVTRFAPSPTGPLTLGQFLRAVVLSHYYARRYNGKFILRFEDTDPRKIEKRFYEWIKEDLKACGIDYDAVVLQSERLELYYTHAKKLINSGNAYVCTCSKDSFIRFKSKLEECPCRALSIEEHLERWERMFKEYKEGSAVVRLKLSMRDKNPVLRDPPIMRIIDHPHPLQGCKYRVWPLYNFCCAIDDHLLGITHVFRGKEHEHNTAIQRKIHSMFGWHMPIIINFGMIKMPGKMIHTRDIKVMIKEGKVEGWDDPSLPTIRALLRRGFMPQAIKECGLSCGLSKTDIEFSWENLYGFNRRLVDSIANRYMVVIKPIKIEIDGAPKIKMAKEPYHPNHPERGEKVLPVDTKNIYISHDDFKRFNGGVVRLKGLFNIKLGKKSTYKGNELVEDMPKIQWVSKPNVEVEIKRPEGKEHGLGEVNLVKEAQGKIIQMERIGFGRIDGIDEKKGKVCIYFAHK
ncbi:MAG: glutamate--tRNA ligase [Candidatus Aenigmatarchaeota archaeon]|nr:MAG: glutamate--tRNA ligase [Candidatus Aenigmarchaeota archaeon]